MFGKKEKTNDNSQHQRNRIVILGSNCDKCNELENNVKKALEKLNIDETVGHITDFVEIAKLGVMSTPTLVIDKKVVLVGRVASESEIEKILKEHFSV